MEETMQSGTLFSLGQYVFIMVVSWLATLIICYALYLLWTLKKQRNFECAPSLLVYLLSMLLCCFALGAQYALLVLFSFLDNPFSPTQLIFWTGLFPGSLLPATPISVLFLSLDRLLIVLLPSIYMRKATKLGLALASTLAIAGLFSLNFGVNFAQRPRKEVPECISFGCLTSDASRLIYAVNRLVVALPNFIAGTAFLVVLIAFRRRLEKTSGAVGGTTIGGSNANRSRKMGDRLAFWVVIFELTLDLVPNIVNFVLTTYGINISVYVGAFRSISYCLCAFCSASAHTAILWHIYSTKTTPRPTKSAVQTMAATGGQPQFRHSASRVIDVGRAVGGGGGVKLETNRIGIMSRSHSTTITNSSRMELTRIDDGSSTLRVQFQQ